MPREIMSDLVESSQRGVSGRSVKMKLVSAGIQIAVITLVVLVPLMAVDSLPAPPEAMMTFLVAPPPPPPPAPPPPAAPAAAERPTTARAAQAPVIPRALPTAEFVAPVEIPEEIGLGSTTELAATGFSSEGGIPGGALGGVPGGIPDAPAEEPVRVGGEVRPPAKIQDVPPEYPAVARQARVEGTVILEAVIDPRGVVSDVRVLKSIPLLDEAALEAVKQWRYEATLLNGEAVPIVMTVTVNFGLA